MPPDEVAQAAPIHRGGIPGHVRMARVARQKTRAEPKMPAGGAIATEAPGFRSIESPAPQSAVPTPPTAKELEHQKRLASVRTVPVFWILMRVVSIGTP